MADNYLENQFEQYQARKAAWEREKKLGKRKTHPTPPPTTGKAASAESTTPAESVKPDTGATPPSCVDCGTQNCKYKTKTYPDFCLTTHLDPADQQWALERYDEGRNHDIMVASAEVEYEGYCQWTRVEEIMHFARKIGAHKIGIANCIGLVSEARIFARILRENGFEVYSVVCKVAGQAKSSVGIPQQCESIGAAMCNPILQARLLNKAQTDLNVVIGLCVGHDSLFYKYSDAYVTTLVTKDRVTGNNPAATLYTAHSYYRKKLS